MKYHPEKREEILAKRAERELKHKTNLPQQKSRKPDDHVPSLLEERIEKYHKMKLEKKTWRSRIDDFLDSEENQKKYGFTTEIVDGFRCIYYDGDIEVLNEAMYGPSVNCYPETDADRTMHLSMTDDCLYARVPGSDDEIRVKLKTGTEESEDAYFSIVTMDGEALTQLCIKDPAYFPDEDACRYLLDMRSLTVLNEYVMEHFSEMIEEWSRLHPGHALHPDIPLPNYRFLGSYAYSQEKKNNRRS